jgi:hypothetical protein
MAMSPRPAPLTRTTTSPNFGELSGVARTRGQLAGGMSAKGTRKWATQTGRALIDPHCVTAAVALSKLNDSRTLDLESTAGLLTNRSTAERAAASLIGGVSPDRGGVTDSWFWPEPSTTVGGVVDGRSELCALADAATDAAPVDEATAPAEPVESRQPVSSSTETTRLSGFMPVGRHPCQDGSVPTVIRPRPM